MLLHVILLKLEVSLAIELDLLLLRHFTQASETSCRCFLVFVRALGRYGHEVVWNVVVVRDLISSYEFFWDLFQRQRWREEPVLFISLLLFRLRLLAVGLWSGFHQQCNGLATRIQRLISVMRWSILTSPVCQDAFIFHYQVTVDVL